MHLSELSKRINMISISPPSIPPAERPLPLMPIAPKKSMPFRQPLKVLLVDDSPIDQIITGDMLRKLGHDVDIADNGREAIQAVEQKYYDLLIMDVQMPEMDGIQAARCIRSRHGSSFRIVFATGSSPIIYREMCLNAGGDDFLTKPLTIRGLDEAIRRM
jgi:CheY-like chemotaxis protein